MRTFSDFRVVPWVIGMLLAVAPVVRVSAEESSQQILTALSSSTISGFVDTSAEWKLQSGNLAIPEPSTTALAGLGGIGLCLWRRSLRKR